MRQRPPTALYPAAFSYRRPVLESSPLYADILQRVRTPHLLDRTTHALERLPARSVQLGGYSPLGPGTVKYPYSSRQ